MMIKLKARELKLQFSRRFTSNQTHTDNSSVWHQKSVSTNSTTWHSKSACLNKVYHLALKFFYLAPKMWLNKFYHLALKVCLSYCLNEFYYLALKVCLFQLSIIQLTTLSVPNNTSSVIVYSSLITNVPCMAVLPVFSQSILKKSANISFTTVVLSVGPETSKWAWGILKWARSFQHQNIFLCEMKF